MHLPEHKITADHLRRDAYLYVRQSSLRQVAEHGESTQRQYALRDRAIAAGWPVERIHVIDSDLGKSGASAKARDGFQHLVSEVALAKAGIVMGLEVSRLARNSSDWHRLLELCALTNTLILDEDGIYDPAAFNDRLLLGLKGTMSEAELHILKARMRGGQINKARRGELEMPPPIGLIYRADGTIGLDPDMQVQNVIRMVFDTFDRTASAMKTVRTFREQGILFPRRLRSGPNKGELVWALPQQSRILQILHNPRYAGAFVYGRTRSHLRPDGSTAVVKVPREQWQFVMPGAHQGYIEWERFEANQRRLTDNARALGGDRRSGPPREGPALLQGRVLCGLCGERMGVRYHRENSRITPTYVCQADSVRRGGPLCQTVPGKVVDAAVSTLLMELITPINLEVTLAVQRELQERTAEIDAVRRQHVERTRYDADLARRRYMNVDPDNRLVVDTLEAEWNERLRIHTDAAADYDRLRKEEIAALDRQTQQGIRDLALRFPQIWQDPRVPSCERKRIVRLLVDDVTLIKGPEITAHVRLSGGTSRTLLLAKPLPIAQIRKFKPELVAEVDRLLDSHCDREIADIFNQRGLRTWENQPFNLKKITHIRIAYKLPSRYQRLRSQGKLTTREMANQLHVSENSIHEWGRQGLIKKCYSDKLGRGLWEIAAGYTIVKGFPGKRARPARLIPTIASSTKQGAV